MAQRKSSQTTACFYTYPMPHGALTIRANGRGVTDVAFGARALEGARRPTALTNRAATELQEYFAGRRQYFDVPIDLEGSAFQLAVWNEVRAIPYAEARTAADVARALGKPRAFGSVGIALRANPCAILVPDHRVTGAQSGAVGPEARIRQGLLAMERRYCS